MEHVQEEIECFFEDRSAVTQSESAFLAEAKRALPADLYQQVRAVYRASKGDKPPALVNAGR